MLCFLIEYVADGFVRKPLSIALFAFVLICFGPDGESIVLFFFFSHLATIFLRVQRRVVSVEFINCELTKNGLCELSVLDS
jgi:hypothetical protein